MYNLNSCHHGHLIQEHLEDEPREEKILPQKLRLWNSTTCKNTGRIKGWGGGREENRGRTMVSSFFLPFDPPLICLLIIELKKCSLQTLGPSITQQYWRIGKGWKDSRKIIGTLTPWYPTVKPPTVKQKYK